MTEVERLEQRVAWLEKQLEQTQQDASQLRGLYENAALAFGITDESGAYVDCNETLCTMFGVSRDEVIGKLTSNLVREANFAGREERIRKLLSGEVKHNTYERRIVRRDGSAIWVQLKFSLISRDPVRLLGAFEDITARVTADHALRESEQRFRGLYENATLGFVLTDADGMILDCNDMLCNVFGLARTDVIGRFSPSVFSPEDVPSANERIRQLVAGEVKLQSYEKRFHRKDGSSIWLHFTFSIVNHDPVRLLGSFQDISGRVAADAAMRASEERFRAVYENAGVGFAITSPEGLFLECNEMLCKLVGYTHEELVGKHAASVLLPTEVDAAHERTRALLAGEVDQQSFDRELHHKDGTKVWINLTFSVMSRDAAGTPTRLLGVFLDITARKQLEEDLGRTKERLELGTRNSGTTVFDLDIPQPELAASRGITPRHGPRATLTLVGWENFGYDPATDITEPDRIGRMLHHPDDHQHADQVTQGYLSGALPKLETEYRIRHADGSFSWRLVRGQAQWDATGRPTRLIGSMVDITELKRIETELRESEQRFRATFENAAVGFSVSSPDGILQDCNDTLCRLFGYPRDQLIGRHGPSLLFPYDVDATRERLRGLVAGDVPFYTLDKHYDQRDGSTTWVNVTFSIMSRDASGAPDRILGVFLDITERINLEDSLRRTRERMELGIRGSGTTIFEIEMPHANLSRTTLSLINGWEQFGYVPPPPIDDAEEIRAMIVHPDDQASSHATTAKYLRGETPHFESEYRVIHKDGSISWWLTRGEAIRDPDGKPRRLLGSMVNITEMKRIVEELRTARQAAELANRAKDEFLANVSHEIRTPMNAILGMTELALDASETAHQRQLLSTVKVASRNLLHVINDLLDFSKITAGKLALDHADFSLRAAIGDTLRALAVRAHRKGLELACDVSPDVPDFYFGDAGRVRQVLINLIGNAIKFTPRGEVVVRAMLDRDAPPGDDAIALRFTVRDTGIGIAPEKHASIFRAFEQEDASTTRKFGGTGLGLTISSQLAALMGGRISVDSEPGRGSTFSFTARISRSTKPEWPGIAGRGPLEGLEVLVVDDNQTNREIMVEWLVRWRMRPTPAADAATAFKALEASPHPLVLLDGSMPDGDGIALALELRARFGSSAHRLILLSSDHSPAVEMRSREAGIQAYLVKPVQPSELLETIRYVMNASEPGAPPRLTTASATAARAAALNVLVAEDNELNVSVLLEVLDQRHHRIDVAGDGRIALERATAEHAAYDVMLLDLHMPEMDGFEVVQAIREREHGTGKHLPIIALTARSSARDREKALAAGMDEFVSKPIELGELWAAIERVTAGVARAQRSRLLDARVIIKTCGGKQAVLDRLGELFRRGVPEQMAATRAAFDRRAFPRLGQAAHMLAGTLSAFSPIASALGSTLEDAALDEDLERCTSLVDQLESACATLLEETRGLTLESLGR